MKISKKKIRNKRNNNTKTYKKNRIYQQTGGGFFARFFSSCLPSGKKVITLPDDINKEVTENFEIKFKSRINYFEDEKKYNKNIVDEAKELLANTAESQTYGIMEDINYRIKKLKKEVHTVSLHGYMITEPLHRVLPHNVILCNIATPKRANINFNEYVWNIHKFFQMASTSLINMIFKERSLHSLPNNFKLLQDVYKLSKNTIYTFYNSLECFKKASWYYPFQKYYDINLKAGGTSNIIFNSYFGKKIVHTDSIYKKKTIKLSKLIEKFSKDSRDSIILVVTTSCQPFDLGDTAKIIDQRARMLNDIFKYMAIMYDLNLSLDETLNAKSLPSDTNISVRGKLGTYCQPFCQTINERSINMLASGTHSDYYFTNPFVKRSHNLDRDYPFFTYIQQQIGSKVLPKKTCSTFAGFIETLSFRKKLIFYQKLNENNFQDQALADRNINLITQELRKNSKFVSYSLKIFSILIEKYGKNFSQFQGLQKQIIEFDLISFMEVLKLLYFKDKFSKSLMTEVNENLQTFFMGKNFKDMVFFYSQIFTPFKHPSPKKIKKMKLLKCNLSQDLLDELFKTFSNVSELDFQDLHFSEETQFLVSNKMTHLTFINCQNLNLKLPPPGLICKNIAHLYLDNVATNPNLVIAELPLLTLVVKNLPKLKILNVARMKLKYFKVRLITNCHFSTENIEAQDFSLDYQDLNEGSLYFNFNKFKPDKILIPNPLVLFLYLKGVIQVEKSVPSVEYQGEVPQDLKKDLLDCIKKKNNIWGSNTTFILEQESNKDLYIQIEKEYKKYLANLNSP